MVKRITGLVAATLLALSMLAAPALADDDVPRGCENMKKPNPISWYC